MIATTIDLMGFGGGPGCVSGINYRGEIMLGEPKDGLITCFAAEPCERNAGWSGKWESVPVGSKFIIGCATIREIKLK